MDFRILTYDALPSTNTEAASQAKLGAPEGVCIVAEQQTAGRGRYGKQWESPAGAGLYFSIILRPKLDSRLYPLITLTAAVAVSNSLSEDFGLPADIKWPNDILSGEKKICGILAETTESNTGTAVILGIGFNLRSDLLSGELSETATSLFSETGESADANEVLRSVLARFSPLYGSLRSEEGSRHIREEWCRRSSYCTGKRVRATKGNAVVEGVTDGIDEFGRLRLVTEDGLVKIEAGEVSSVRTAEDV